MSGGSGGVSDWLPILEKLSQDNKAFVLVSDVVEDELLTTLIANDQPGTIKNVVVHKGSGKAPTGVKMLEPKTLRVGDLVPTSMVWTRRSATAIITVSNNAEDVGYEEIDVLKVGGDNSDDALDRFNYAARLLAASDHE